MNQFQSQSTVPDGPLRPIHPKSPRMRPSRKNGDVETGWVRTPENGEPQINWDTMAIVLRGGLARRSVTVIAPRKAWWSDVSWLGVCRWITSDSRVFVFQLVIADLIVTPMIVVPMIVVPVIVVPVIVVPVVLVRMLSNVDVGHEVVDGAFGG